MGQKKAIEIRKRKGATMNQDKGQYFLSHVYDELLLKNLQRGETQLPTTISC